MMILSACLSKMGASLAIQHLDQIRKESGPKVEWERNGTLASLSSRPYRREENAVKDGESALAYLKNLLTL